MRAKGLIAGALLVLACGGDVSAEGGGEPPPTPVEVTQGRRGALQVERTYLGMVRSVARAEIAAEAAGEVLEVTVREGDRVEAGQLLMRIDANIARADLMAARAAAQRTHAEHAQAASDARRFERAGPSTVAQLEIERAATQASALDAARQSNRAQVARARESLDRTRVLAPFAGVIAARYVDPGDFVGVGARALELVAVDATEVLVRVEPALLADVEVGTPARLMRGDASLAASVVGVVRALDPATRTAQLRLAPTETASWLLAGAAVDVRFRVEHEGDGLIVPRDALVPGVAQTRVMTVVEGRAVAVPVEVLERGATEARITGEGLTPETVIVTRGNDRLRPEQAVRMLASVSEPAAP